MSFLLICLKIYILGVNKRKIIKLLKYSEENFHGIYIVDKSAFLSRPLCLCEGQAGRIRDDG